jgi:hypothetical protein
MGPDVPELMFDAVEGGVVIEVVTDGKARRAEDHDSALALLRSLELSPQQPNADQRGRSREEPSRE